jgi:hypothetical protein
MESSALCRWAVEQVLQPLHYWVLRRCSRRRRRSVLLLRIIDNALFQQNDSISTRSNQLSCSIAA